MTGSPGAELNILPLHPQTEGRKNIKIVVLNFFFIIVRQKFLHTPKSIRLIDFLKASVYIYSHSKCENNVHFSRIYTCKGISIISF